MTYIERGSGYEGEPLHAAELGDDPLAAVREWLDDAFAAGVPQPNAVSLATASDAGRPSVRTVLVKAIDTGLVFFSNYGSRKGVEIDANPWAAASFTWLPLHRQVRASGRVEQVTADESDEYWQTRPRGAQLAAAASAQSRLLVDRAELEARVEALDAEYPDDVPRPTSWGGYRLTPVRVEFWAGRADRMHDRIEYLRDGQGWLHRRLYP